MKRLSSEISSEGVRSEILLTPLISDRRVHSLILKSPSDSNCRPRESFVTELSGFVLETTQCPSTVAGFV